jgi:hypothetical protein
MISPITANGLTLVEVNLPSAVPLSLLPSTRAAPRFRLPLIWRRVLSENAPRFMLTATVS